MTTEPAALQSTVVDPVSTSTAVTQPVLNERRGAIAWALVEAARNPYVSLIFMFVFAPYFAATVVRDVVRGQELWSFSYTLAGVLIAVVAPIIGAVVDRMGRRKPWVLGSVAVMAPVCGSLWFAMPGAIGGLSVAAIALLIIVLMLGFEIGAVAHNAMLPSIAGALGVGRVSGLGLAAGAAASLTVLLVVLFSIVLPATPGISWAILPARPMFGLDPAAYEHARIVGPIAGGWMAILVVPFLLWTPDVPSTGVSLSQAVSEGFAQLRSTLRQARQHRNISVFLLARMLYNDGMIAIQAYCGIYAAGVFGWDLATIMIFALILTVFCIAGGFLGGWLAERLGSRSAILVSLAGTCVATLLAVSVTRSQLFFFPFDAVTAKPLWSLPYFQTLPELVYLAMYCVLAVTITATIVNGRVLIARIAPPQMMTQFFGLYALSGTATAFLGHAMVASFTRVFHSQRVGIASLLLLLVAGWVLLRRVVERTADGNRAS